MLTNLINIYEEMTVLVNKQAASIAYLDFRKAFDTVKIHIDKPYVALHDTLFCFVLFFSGDTI